MSDRTIDLDEGEELIEEQGSAQQDTSPDPEDTDKSTDAQVFDLPSAKLDEVRPVLGKATYKLPSYIIDVYRNTGMTLNQPFEGATIQYAIDHPDAEQEDYQKRYEAAMELALPLTNMHDRLTRDKSFWTNTVVVEDRKCCMRAIVPKGDDVVRLFRSNNATGQDIEVTFFNTGIVIAMRPPLDSELVDLEHKIATDRSAVGMKTYGEALTADMGVHLGHLVDFALGLVTWTNLQYEGDMVAGLRTYLRGRESIDVLMATMMATMYPGGFPWTIQCHAGDCTAEENIDLFFARSQWTDMSLLTDVHHTTLHRNSKVLTEENCTAYLDALPNSTGILEHNGTVFNLGLPSIGDYANSTRRWQYVIEHENASALEAIDSPIARQQFLDARTASRALLEFSHYVRSIEVNNGKSTITTTDRKQIEEILVAGSTDIMLVAKFMQTVPQFELDSRTTFVGHANRTCPVCGKAIHNAEGPWASIVPLPVDRIFFTHMRLKIQLLHGLRDRI